MRMFKKGEQFADVKADGHDAPTFSESFLYDTVGKGEARFILAVADEYEHVIEALGPVAVNAILDVKPRLVRRLKVGDEVRESLEDAMTDESLRREQHRPFEITLDHDAAHAAWDALHSEYTRYYEPEKSMGTDRMRAYNALTDALGEWEQGERERQQGKAAEKLERKERQKKLNRRRAKAFQALEEANESGEGLAEAVKEFMDAENARYA